MCCTNNSPIMLASFLSVPSSFVLSFALYVLLSPSVQSLIRTFYGASVTLSLKTVLWIPVSSTVTVSGVADISLNTQRVFHTNFVSSEFAMCADLVICKEVLSTKTCFPG